MGNSGSSSSSSKKSNNNVSGSSTNPPAQGSAKIPAKPLPIKEEKEK